MASNTPSTRNPIVLATSILAVIVVAAMVVAWRCWPPFRPELIPTSISGSVGGAMSDYIRSLGYRPLSIPVNEWGPGTVIRFVDGKERIVRFNEKCLKLKVPVLASGAKGTNDVKVADATLPDEALAYDRSRSATGSVEFGKALEGNLNLGGALSDNLVSQIAITIGEAKEFVAAEGDIKDSVKAIRASTASCSDDLADPKNYIVLSALVVGKSSVAFIGKNGSDLKIDSNLLKKLNASEDLIAKTAGHSSMNIPNYRIVGYQLFQVGVANGSAASVVSAHRLSLPEIDALIARSASEQH